MISFIIGKKRNNYIKVFFSKVSKEFYWQIVLFNTNAFYEIFILLYVMEDFLSHKNTLMCIFERWKKVKKNVYIQSESEKDYQTQYV